jgi:hypothetical protein
MKEKTLENYLKQDDFEKLKNTLLGEWVPWYYNELPSEYSFTHSFYKNHQVATSHFEIITPFIALLKPKAIVEIKAYLFPMTKNVITYPMQFDQPFKNKGAIFFVNSNDGCTMLDTGKSIESVENRMSFFNTYHPYWNTSCTNENCRVLINFNYF